MRSATATASPTEVTASPGLTGMPWRAKNCLPWYSNRSKGGAPVVGADAGGGFVHHRAGWRYYGRGRHPSQPRPVSPVAQSRGHAGRALLVAGAGVVVAIGIAFAVANLASRGTVDVRLGSDTFGDQDAEEIAD